MRQQTFQRNSWNSTYRHKFLRYHKLTETQNGFCTNSFGSVRQNDYDRKSWFTLRAPLSLAFFGARKRYNSRGFPSKSLGTVRYKNFRLKKLTIPLSALAFIQKNFFLPETCERQNRWFPLRRFLFSVLRDGKNSTENCDLTPSIMNFFDTRN